MKLDQLDGMLSRMNPSECISFFQGSSEADRKAASARVLQWNETFEAYQHANSWQVKNQIAFGQKLTKRAEKAILIAKELDSGRLVLPKEVKLPACAGAINLALLATCGFTEAKKLQFTSLDEPLIVLRDRKPKWFASWLEMMCAQHPVGLWNTIEDIEQEGLCKVERGDNYLFSMALTLGQLEAQHLLTRLEKDAELQTLMWAMLESETTVAALHDPYSLTERKPSIVFDPRKWTTYLEEWQRASYIWKSTLTEAACSQRLDRARLLNLCFDWITRLTGDGESVSSNGMGDATSPAEWWQSIHDEVALVEQRKQIYSHRYIGLLSAKDNRTLSWAINHLSGCSALPLDDVFFALPPVLLGKRKDPAIAALKLLEEIGARGDEEATRVSLVALDGLDHSSADIQKRVISLLKKLRTASSPVVAQSLQERIHGLSGLTKQAALKLIPEGLQSEPEPLTAIQEVDETELSSRVGKVPENFRGAAGLAEALSAVLQDAPLPAVLKLMSANIPRLNPDKMIRPINDLDDLLYLVLRVLEDNASAEEFDQALDGISRLCAFNSLDFSVRVSALNKRVQTILPEGDQLFSAPFTGVNPVFDVAAVCRAWITAKAPSDGLFKQLGDVIANSGIFNSNQDHHGPSHFFSLRAQEVAKRAAAKQALPLLSAPTHEGGWIDPVVLSERINVWLTSKTKFDKADFIQSLLRLAPERRAEALKHLPQLDDEYFNSLRWALGDEVRGQMKTAELWVAAFRCREPRGESALLQSKFPDLGAGSATIGGVKECLDEYAKREKSIFGTSMDSINNELPLVFDPPSRQRGALKYFPTELLRDPKIRWDMSDVSELLWPQDRESFFYLQARRMSVYLESDGNYWKSSWDCLFDPDVNADGAGAWLIALGLSARQGETSRTALDALIGAIEDTRISGSSLGKVMAKLLPTGKITLTRWARAIKETARISPLHARFVLDALAECFVRLPKDSWKTPPISLLEIAYETGTTHGVKLAHWHLGAILDGIEGKGKAVKLAKLIRTMPDTKDSSFKRVVALQILESRLLRAQRWATWERAQHQGAQAVVNMVNK